MPTLEEAKRIMAWRRSRSIVDYLVVGARLRSGESAAQAAAGKLAALLPDRPEVPAGWPPLK
jgi:hypothetical protein